MIFLVTKTQVLLIPTVVFFIFIMEGNARFQLKVSEVGGAPPPRPWGLLPRVGRGTFYAADVLSPQLQVGRHLASLLYEPLPRLAAVPFPLVPLG